MEDEAENIKNINQSRLKPSIKFYIYISLELSMSEDVEDMLLKIANFQSIPTTLSQSSNILDEIKNHIEVLVDEIDNYTRNGSGWAIEDVELITL